MVNLRYFPLILALGVVLLASGCAPSPQRVAPVQERELAPPPATKAQEGEPVPQAIPEAAVTHPGPPPEPSPEYRELPVEKAASSTPAVVALLDDAEQNSAAGRRGAAAASLERALRIEPKNPVLWHKLSQVRFEEKNWQQALALAKKSNVLAPGDKSLQASNWRIIALCSEQLGDKSGAEKAWEMVRRLE